MTTPFRIGGPTPQLIQTSNSAGPARVAFSSRLMPSGVAPAASGGITGRQVVSAALNGIASPRSLVTMVAGIVGGPVGGAVAGIAGQAADSLKQLQLLDQVRTYIMTNAIFDAANAPVVESNLNES